ncbi:hypothetical protein V8C26DRAFT_267152 [Trichoderma gracile]
MNHRVLLCNILPRRRKETTSLCASHGHTRDNRNLPTYLQAQASYPSLPPKLPTTMGNVVHARLCLRSVQGVLYSRLLGHVSHFSSHGKRHTSVELRVGRRDEQRCYHLTCHSRQYLCPMPLSHSSDLAFRKRIMLHKRLEACIFSMCWLKATPGSCRAGSSLSIKAFVQPHNATASRFP